MGPERLWRLPKEPSQKWEGWKQDGDRWLRRRWSSGPDRRAAVQGLPPLPRGARVPFGHTQGGSRKLVLVATAEPTCQVYGVGLTTALWVF